MNKYEILYIIDNEIDDEKKNALVDRFADLVKSLGGEVDGVDKWGVKKFAYPIDYKTEGFYVLMNFSANAETPLEVERQMRITDSIIRQMIIRK